MKTEENSEFSMFAPTSAEDAANQSNTNRGMETVADILKPGILRHTWEEGDNWMRFITTRGNAWFRDVTYFEMRSGNKVARVAHQDQIFGEVNLLLSVQIGLYQNPETRPLMRTRENDKGFSFREHRKAYLVASRWENTLSPFGIVNVTLGKLVRKKDMKYREAWGDALVKIPTEMTVDPTLPMEQNTKPQARWGSVFDPVDGRLIKCSFTNVGTVDIAASFAPADRTMPLGTWEGPQKLFVPKPQYTEILRQVPSLKDSFRRLTVEEQMDLVRTFVPVELLPYAEKIMQAKLTEGRPARQVGTKGTSAPTATVAAPGAVAPVTAASELPAPVQIPVPQDEPTQLGETDKLYLDFVKELGSKFSQVGEEVARKLIKLGLVNPANVKQMAAFQPDMLKTLASAS